MTKRLVLATVAGSVVQFLLGFLVYGLLLANFMKSCSIPYDGLMKDMNTAAFMILMFVSGLSMMFMIAYIFQRWAKFDTFMKGLNGGVFIGFFFALTYDLSSYSMMNLFTFKGLVVDVITASVMMGINGGVIAWILGWKKKD